MAVTGKLVDPRYFFLQELRAQNFDLIRFASYRTALHFVDIWNVIESFRENGLNTLDNQSEINITRLEALISNLYHNLNKRLPSLQQVSVESLSSMLLNWLLSAYRAEVSGKIKVLSVKVALATMCAGKLLDKLRYIFSQICDGNGNIVMWKFNDFLQEILALPAAVYESPSFTYTSQLANDIFLPNSRVNLSCFIDVMMTEPGPPCLVWFPLLHRLSNIETVIHPVPCDVCRKENFTGFRYRCQKCHSFQLCQDCFWRGRIASSHTLDHEVKEYTAYKSPTKQISHTLRKSFRCVPDKTKSNIPRFPEELEKPINLSYIVPPSPLPTHNGFPEPGVNSMPYDFNSLDSRSTIKSSGKYSSFNASQVDDEHKLIARYAARLAAEVASVGRTTSEGSLSLDTSRAQRELIFQLENKNREIMKEIARLRKQQEAEEFGGLEENPALMNELRALRLRKHELESHLTTLQDSRKHLMVQLEGLMKLLKNHQPSPRSTPNSSPRSAKSPPPSRSAPPTPGGSVIHNLSSADALTGDVRSAFTGTSNVGQSVFSSNNSISGNRSFRNDLLVAADSVTSAMSTLVRELNSDINKITILLINNVIYSKDDSEDEDSVPNSNIVRPLDFSNGKNLER
ncbi:hypothetical protein PGB90_001372 [Kerria lacca]